MNPFGEERDDLRAGVVASMIGNVNLKKNARPFTPADFVLNFGTETPKPAQTPEEMKSVLERALGIARPRNGRPRKSE